MEFSSPRNPRNAVSGNRPTGMLVLYSSTTLPMITARCSILPDAANFSEKLFVDSVMGMTDKMDAVTSFLFAPKRYPSLLSGFASFPPPQPLQQDQGLR